MAARPALRELDAAAPKSTATDPMLMPPDFAPIAAGCRKYTSHAEAMPVPIARGYRVSPTLSCAIMTPVDILLPISHRLKFSGSFTTIARERARQPSILSVLNWSKRRLIDRATVPVRRREHGEDVGHG